MSYDSSNNNTPTTRTFQLDDGRVGRIQNSVNMFRGDVNYVENLVSLRGRNGLDVNLTATYQSNIQKQVTTWNETKPTGILGVGWLLPYVAIVMDAQNSTSPFNNQYYLVNGEQVNPLVATGQKDVKGNPLFELRSYEFWTIVYDATEELWTITQEDGIVKRFGGRNSGRATVRWGIAWDNWIGSSAKVENQTRYATAWNIAEVVSPYNDTIMYGYEAIEQKVGNGTLTYTKSSYLKQITDTYGRKINLFYADKIFDRSRNIMEYGDPDKQITGSKDVNSPDAFQNQYETRYLDYVEVSNSQGKLINRIRLSYAVQNYSKVPSQDTAYPLLYKRYLTGIIQETPQGLTQPGLKFDYYAADDPHVGALKSITYPTGGTATYLYDKQEITTYLKTPSSNTLIIDRDFPLRCRVLSPFSGNNQVRVWHGADYIVLAWYDGRGTIAVRIYEWHGMWVEWRESQNIQADIDLDALNVSVSSDFFCLNVLDRSQRQEQVHLFRKIPTQIGGWERRFFSVPVGDPKSRTSVTAGQGFVMLANNSYTQRKFNGWTWNTRANQWDELRAIPGSNFQISSNQPEVQVSSSGTNFYMASSYVNGTCFMQLFYRDPTENVNNGWKTGAMWSERFAIYQQNSSDPLPLIWSMGETFAVATHITNVKPISKDTNTIEYSLRFYHWDSKFNVPQPRAYVENFSLPASKDQTPVEPLYTVTQGSTVGNAGNIFRNVGGTPRDPAGNWTLYRRSTAVDLKTTYNLAYGEDVALMSAQNGTGRTDLISFDPNQPTRSGWRSQSIENRAEPVHVMNKTVAVGNDIYTRLPNMRWDKLRRGLAYTANFDTSSVRTDFIATDDDSHRTVYVSFLQNESVLDAERLTNPSQRVTDPDLGVQGGTMLVGVTAFATLPADRSLNSTNMLYLYRTVDNTVNGKIYDYPVTCIIINDAGTEGQNFSQYYQYDSSGVTYDPRTGMTQYAKVTVLPGSADKSQGYVEYFYSNGVSDFGREFYPEGTVYNANHVLNGMLLRQRSYNPQGAMVAQTTYTYRVYRNRRTGNDATAPTVWLTGGWMRLVEQEDILDGVKRISKKVWDEFSGLCVNENNTDYDGSGKQVTIGTSYLRAYQVSQYQQAFMEKRMLSAVAVTTETVDTQIIRRTVATWSTQQLPTASAVFLWKGSGSGDFDFAQLPIKSLADWQLVKAVTANAPSEKGMLPIEHVNVDGVPEVTIYDADYRFKIADFPNAALSEASFYGFEDYEQNPGWTLTNAQITQSNPATGQNCLKIAPNGRITLTQNPTRRNQQYAFSAWVRTTAPGAQLTLAATTQPITQTDGKWHHVYLIADLSGSDGQPIQLTLNAGNGDVFVDHLRFSPLLSNFTAQVYDPLDYQSVALINGRGAIMRYAYDAYRRTVVEAGPDDGINTVYAQYNSRSANNDVYQAQDPNTHIRIKPQGTGAYDDFRATSADWAFAGGTWNVDTSQRQLTHRGTAGRAVFQPSSNFKQIGIRVGIASAGNVASVGVAIGDKIQARWSGNQWQLMDGTNIVDSAAGALKDLIVITSGTVIQLIVDGKPLMQHDFGKIISGAVSLMADGDVNFTSFAVFERSIVLATFRDGADKEIQSQAYDGQDWVVRETVYDTLARPAIQTKAAKRATPGYWASLVTSIDWATGVMQGDINTYYGANGAGYSDDGGYPYVRTRFDGMMLRPVEIGQPGAPYAINLNQPEAERKTQRTNYGNNQNADFGLPAGKYFTESATDQDNRPSITLKNGRGQVIVKSAPADNNQHMTFFYEYDAAGNPTKIRMPVTGGEVAMQYDFIGRLTRETMPNYGDPKNPDQPKENKLMYDEAGRLRFFQTPQMTAENQVAYLLYDVLGRKTEEGLFSSVWNETTLKDYALNKPAEPKNGNWQKHYHYDGTTLNQLMRLVRVEVKEGDLIATEEYQYDLFGNLQWQSMSNPAFSGETYQVDYVYNRVGGVLKMSYNDLEAHYIYNNLGLVQSIGTVNDPAAYAHYTYTPDGKVLTETLNSTSPLVRDYAYNSPGWMTSIRDPLFQETLSYDGYFDGRISSESFTDVNQSSQLLGNQYTYNKLGWLQEARGAVVLNQTDSTEVFSYDLNGNIQGVDGSVTQQYTYYGGTDRVKNINGTDTEVFRYDLNGNITTSALHGLELGYDLLTARAMQIRTSQNGTLNFSYDGRGYRSVKSGDNGKTLYLYDPYMRPIVVHTLGSEPSLIVQGPNGIVALKQHSKTYFVLRDRNRSTRVVIDENNAMVSAYRYAPFGQILATAGNAQIIPFLFTGQVYDWETGLYNFNTRLYDPVLRRFYSIDQRMINASPYVYVDNNPLMYVDPNGKELVTILVVIIIGAVVGATAGLVTGLVLGFTQNWTAQQNAWRIPLMVLTGAVFGALSAAIGLGAAAAGGAAATSLSGAVAATSWFATAAGQKAVEFGVAASLSLTAAVALGPAQGAIDAALQGEDAGKGALSGLISGAISGAIGGVLGGVSTAFKGVVGIGLEEGVEYTQRQILKTAALEFGIGTVEGTVGSGIEKGIDAARGDDVKWYNVLTGVILGGIGGGLGSDGVTTSMKRPGGANVANVTNVNSAPPPAVNPPVQGPVNLPTNPPANRPRSKTI